MGCVTTSTNGLGIMQRLLTIITMVLFCLTLAACGSKYVVTTKSGQTYIADGPLELNVDDNTYTVKDKDGNTVKLNQEDVDKVAEKEN